jgi:hypothetical protein
MSRILTRTMKRDNIAIGIGIFSFILVTAPSLEITTNSTIYFNTPTIHFAYGQSSQINSNSNSNNNTNTNSLDIQNIPAKKSSCRRYRHSIQGIW